MFQIFVQARFLASDGHPRFFSKWLTLPVQPYPGLHLSLKVDGSARGFTIEKVRWHEAGATSWESFSMPSYLSAELETIDATNDPDNLVEGLGDLELERFIKDPEWQNSWTIDLPPVKT